MPFTPDFPDELLRRFLSRLVGTSRLVDLAEGSETGTYYGRVADELSSQQFKLKEFHAAHFFDAAGQLLDDRCAQLGPDFSPRRTLTRARGGSFTVIRNNVIPIETFAAGSIKVTRTDLPGYTYTNEFPIAFLAGQPSSTGNSFICDTPGTAGNAPPGAVDVLVAAPSTVGSAYNISYVSGGRPKEEDLELQTRARLFTNSLTATTPTAIKALALNYVDPDTGETPRTVTIWESPDTPGYCEVLIDDGQGYLGNTRNAVTQSGTVPALDSYVARQTFSFESPAVTPPVLTLNGVPYPSPNPDFVVKEEQGVIIMRASPSTVVIGPSYDWSTGGHTVLIGAPARLQRFLNAKCRGSGLRVRVVLPTPTEVQITANVTVFAGYSIPAVFAQIKASIAAYLADLPPGAPLLMFRLGGDLIAVPGVRDIRFDRQAVYPATPRTKFIVYPSSIVLR
jgi:uncharacterized phage protein gp47/JayE